MRRWFTLLALTACLLPHGAWAAPAPAPPVASTADGGWAALQGGSIVLLRHANAPGIGDAHALFQPCPGPALCTHMLPPISSASRLLMASPRPVPPYLRVVEASAWLKL